MADDLKVIVDADAGPLRRELGSAGGAVRIFGDEVGKGSRGSRAFSAAVDKQKNSLHGLTSVAKTAGIGIAGALAIATASAIKTGAAFESQMARVKAVTGATEKQMGQLKKQAIQLGADTKFSAGQAAEGMYELASAGFSVQETQKALPGVIALAAASGVELADAAEISANALRGFGLDSSEATHVADVLAQAVNSSSVEMSDLQLSLKYIGPVAHATGESFESMIGAVAVLGDAGIKGEQAGTTLRAGLLQLVKPTKQVEEGLGSLGLKASDLYGPNGLLPLPEIIGKLQAGMGGLSKAQQSAAITSIFGREAFSGMVKVVEAGPEKLRHLAAEFEHSGGASAKAAKTMNDTVQGSFEGLKGSFETAEIELFEHFAPSLKGALKDATSFVNEEGDKLQSALDDAIASPEFKQGDFGKKAEIIVGAIGKVWDESGLGDDIREGMVDAFNYALPKVADAAGKGAVLVAEQFVKGFLNASPLGRLAIAGWLFSKFGGFAALKAAGVKTGAGVATGIEEGAARGVASGSFVSTFRSKLSGLTTIAKGIGVGVAVNGLIGGIQAGMENSDRQLGTSDFLHDFGVGTFRSFGINLGETTGEEFSKGFHQKIQELTSGSLGLGKEVPTGHIEEIARHNASTKNLPAGELVRPEGSEGWTEAFDKEMSRLGSAVKARYPTTKELFGRLWDQMKPEEQQLASQVRRSLIAAQQLASHFKIEAPSVTTGTKAGTFHQFESQVADLRSGVITRMADIRKVFSQNAQLIGSSWQKGSQGWRQATVVSMQAMVSAIQDGMRQGVISTADGKKQIQSVLRDMKLIKGSDPLGIADGFASSWKHAGDINEKGLARVKADLNQMPKNARQVAIDAMVGMAQNLESKGQLVKGSTARLTSAIAAKFGATNKQVEQSTAAAMANLAQSSSEGATNVGAALSNVFDNLRNALAAVGSSKIPTFSLSVLSTAAAYHHKREELPAVPRQSGGIVPGSGDGDKVPRMVPEGTFIMNREATRAFGFQRGGNVPVVLEPGEAEIHPQAVAKIGRHNLEAMNAAVPRFQAGGTASAGGVNFPHPGLVGPEPERSLGQGAIDKGWKAADKYLLAHLEPKRVLAMLHAGEAITSKGFPYVYGGGHGSFGIQPVDCSGLVSYVLNAGGFLDTPMSVQQGSGLYTLGAAGPGKYFTWGVRGSSGANAHTMISVKKPGTQGWGFFESGGSGGGAHEDSGWDGAFSFRHMPGYQKGGSVTGTDGAAVSIPKNAPAGVRKTLGKYGADALRPGSPHFVGWGFQSGGYTGDINHTWAEHEAPDYGGPKLPAFVIAALAEAAGAPGVTMEQVTRGESSGRPGSSGTDAAPTNGNTTKGWGLWAITSGVGNDSLVTPYGGYPEMLNPVKNAAVMATMYGKSGIAPWHGDQFVTGDNLHYTGNYDIKNALGGATFKQALEGKGAGKETAKEEQEHTNKEEVPAIYLGCHTDALSFPSMPNTIEGVDKELRKRRAEVTKYSRAVKAANKHTRPAVAEALQHNITNLQTRIAELTRERTKLRREKAKRHFTARLAKSLGTVTGMETAIEGAQHIYEGRSEAASHLVDEEPTQADPPPAPKKAPYPPHPQLPATATKTEREAARKAYEKQQHAEDRAFEQQQIDYENQRLAGERGYVNHFAHYVNHQERPAYGAVLASENHWRNLILGAEEKAAGNWQKLPTPGGLQGNFETKITGLMLQEEVLEFFADGVTKEIATWRSNPDHKGKDLPDALRKAAAARKAALEKVPVLNFQEKEVRKTLGEARGVFYPGHARITDDPKPPAVGSGTFEDNLAEAQGSHFPGQHERLKALPPTHSGLFGGAIWDTQEAIEGLGLKISEAISGINEETGSLAEEEWPEEEEGSTVEPPDIGAWTAAKEAISQQAIENLALSQGETRTFAGFFRDLGQGIPYLGAFMTGTAGTRVGRSGLAMLHRDEMIVPDPKGPANSQLGGAAPAAAHHEVNLYVDGDVGPLLSKIRAEVDGRFSKVNQRLGAEARRRGTAPGRV